MTAERIASIRRGLGLSQADFANLLGTHVMTVSKWERGIAQPSPYQAALIEHFGTSAQQMEKSAQMELKTLLIGAGVIAALTWLFARNRR